MRRFDPSLVRPGTVSFIRHAERASKDRESGLTRRGIVDSKELGDIIYPTIILASPSPRTVQTAEGISGHRVPIVISQCLRNNIYRDRGAWDALVEIHGKGEVRAMWRRGEISPDIIDPPPVKVHDIFERVLDPSTEGDTVIAVTHNFIVSIIANVVSGSGIGHVAFLDGLTFERSELLGWIEEHPL